MEIGTTYIKAVAAKALPEQGFEPTRARAYSAALLLGAILGCSWIGGLVSGCRSRDALTPQETEGKHLYDVRCAHRHEENDLGLKSAPPNIHHVFAQTALPSGAPATDTEVKRVVVEGKGMMPSFAGRFSPEQMSGLLAYLHRGVR